VAVVLIDTNATARTKRSKSFDLADIMTVSIETLEALLDASFRFTASASAWRCIPVPTSSRSEPLRTNSKPPCFESASRNAGQHEQTGLSGVNGVTRNQWVFLSYGKLERETGFEPATSSLGITAALCY
jgi:hypothetical protein